MWNESEWNEMMKSTQPIHRSVVLELFFFLFLFVKPGSMYKRTTNYKTNFPFFFQLRLFAFENKQEDFENI